SAHDRPAARGRARSPSEFASHHPPLELQGRSKSGEPRHALQHPWRARHVWICAGRPSADPPPPKGGARARGDERARLAAPEEGAVWLGSAMPWRWEPPPREAAARAALLQPGGLTPRAACPSPPPRARAAARARAAPT
ncbi:unnamed protein product, partial [Prorocentrum cordatum]